MKLNGLQWFLIIASILSATAGATSNLTDIFGPGLAHLIVSVAAFGNTIITAVMTPLVGNVAQIKNVAALDGVKVRVTPDAAPSVAAVAVDPNQPNVGALNPTDRPALQAKAQGA